MRIVHRFLAALLVLAAAPASAQISGGFLTEQGGVLQGRAYTWNAGSGINCTLSGTIWTCTAVGGSVATSSPITGDGTGGNPVTCPTCVTSVASLGATTALYCDGHDATCNFNGVASPVCGATLSGSKYTLTRDVCATNATVSTGVDVYTTGYALTGTGTLTLNGTATIEDNGFNAVANNTPAGRLTSNGYFCSNAICGGNGGAAGFHAGNGSNGESTDVTNYSMATGAGGNGGSGCSQTGGTGGTNNIISLATIPYPTRAFAADKGFITSRTGSTVYIVGGPGGGGGCAGAGVLGGAGGTGGGYVYVAFPTIVANGTSSITANGGNGAAAFIDSGGNCGCGGGGGAAGFVKIVTQSITSASFSPVNSSTCTSHWTVGGSPGAAVGAGGAATSGAGGTCYVEIAP